MNSERILLASRYVLLPMFLGLIVYMALYNVAFFGSLFLCVQDFWVHKGDFAKLSDILKLAAIDGIDSVMIGNLIVMVTVGSYSIFVNEIDPAGRKLPRFMKNLTSGMLKIKMSSSLVGVSAVHLLTSFVNVDSIKWDGLCKQGLIHCLFILSAYVFSLIEVMTHPPTTESH